jgi:flagella basal body P-ring formation protein FlgA
VKNYSAKLSDCAFGLLFSIVSLSATANSSVMQELNPFHNHSDITQTAEKFLAQNIDTERYSRIEIHMGQLDQRLKLAQCQLPLETKLAPGSDFSGKTTVHVKCNGNTQWTIFINANIHLYSQVVHTAEPLEKGHILTANDLLLSEINLSEAHYGFFTDIKSLIGKQVKHRLPQNKIIRVNYVKTPTLVKRGEIVTIVAENTGYSVKMSGTAMSSGARGDRVQVKNLSSQRIIEGTVTEPGIININ